MTVTVIVAESRLVYFVIVCVAVIIRTLVCILIVLFVQHQTITKV
jgi:hypothetical protein